ncbi:transmembrane and immunoglobulin domain-containing protein 1-like [Danio aesculapii]|uniref:transmembrane and immunoglobulin domain-containing protein 1-like n=1 Tax=Danio aesculapii TaxID=1142201 RepID=UPI0024C02E8C|nr:transmembrane and immunoglobulin domain-containing protein 1-like [Danio aesculapii]
MAHVFVLVCLWHLTGVFGESVSVMEGDSVTLHTGLNKLMGDDLIKWRFGAENTLIIKINVMASRLTIYEDVLDGRFRDRLKVDQTASLTITNIRSEHAGVYQLQTNSRSKSFRISVYTRLPVPVLFNSPQCSSSSSSSVQYCSVLCSVVNVSAVSLSWYKGNSLLSSISVSDLSISLSLPLEVEYQDNNTYSCVINNTISNQTTHLHINTLWQPCKDSGHCCGPTEAVVRLVGSALVGVAIAAFIFHDIRSRKRED